MKRMIRANADTEYYGGMTEKDHKELRSYEGEEFPEGDYKYQVQECFGAPQAGCSFFNFEEWYEVEEFLDRFPFIMDDIDEGYALIKEL